MRRLRVLAAILVYVAGCRGVLGIQETELVDGEDSGMADATLMDARPVPDAQADVTDASPPARDSAVSDGSPEDTGEERGPEDAQDDGAERVDSALDAADAGADAEDSAVDAHDSGMVDSGAADSGALDSGTDSAAADTNRPPEDSGTAPDTSGPADSGGPVFDAAGYYDGSCSPGPSCPMCCMTTFASGFNKLNMEVMNDGCTCSPEGCATACAATACAVPPVMPDTTCNMCVGPELTKCTAADQFCETDPVCGPAYYCLVGCMP